MRETSMRLPESETNRAGIRLLTHIFVEPLQLLAHLDVAVPGILAETVALTWKHQKAMRNTQRFECAFHGHAFQIADAHVCAALNEMRRRLHLVELEERGLALVIRGVLPRPAAEIPRIVPRLVVVAPVGGV